MTHGSGVHKPYIRQPLAPWGRASMTAHPKQAFGRENQQRLAHILRSNHILVEKPVHPASILKRKAPPEKRLADKHVGLRHKDVLKGTIKNLRRDVRLERIKRVR